MSTLMTFAVQALAVSPSPSPSPTLQVDPDRVTPGALGFFAVVFLGIAVFFLWKSLNKQVKRVDFDEEHTFTRAKDRERYQASQEALDAELVELSETPESAATTETTESVESAEAPEPGEARN